MRTVNNRQVPSKREGEREREGKGRRELADSPNQNTTSKPHLRQRLKITNTKQLIAERPTGLVRLLKMEILEEDMIQDKTTRNPTSLLWVASFPVNGGLQAVTMAG